MLYSIAQWGFALITFVFFGLLLKELRSALKTSDYPEVKKDKIFRNTVIVLLAWMVVTSYLSLSGFLDDFTSVPPRFFLIIIIPLVLIIWLMTTKTVKELLLTIPPQNIIRLQSFRVFVEALLWVLFIANLAPVQMTFEGRNFDVFSGLSAPIIAWLISRNKISRKGVIVWNVACLLLLINIVAIALLSTPTPFRVFMNEPANTIVTKFPIVWLPAFLVPLAYTLNVLSIKQMLLRK
jgi:hypothetical protein